MREVDITYQGADRGRVVRGGEPAPGDSRRGKRFRPERRGKSVKLGHVGRVRGKTPACILRVDSMSVESQDQVAAQEQIRCLREQLARAQRLTALGELTGTTAHEFNNVLTTIINYAKMGLRHPDTATRDKALQKILEASTRAAKITASILGLARNRSAAMEPTDLSSLVDDTLLLLEREMNKYRISVEKHFEPVPPVMANGNQIQQILVNLLINARQAMPSGGRVILKLQLDADQQMVELTVRDTGCGIAPEHLRKIFDPFFTTKQGPDESGKGGTGLGLAHCRDLIEAHRGRIRVESALGKGTAFTIKLPLADGTAAT
jgi:signal transduction histidine kinase